MGASHPSKAGLLPPFHGALDLDGFAKTLLQANIFVHSKIISAFLHLCCHVSREFPLIHRTETNAACRISPGAGMHPA